MLGLIDLWDPPFCNYQTQVFLQLANSAFQASHRPIFLENILCFLNPNVNIYPFGNRRCWGQRHFVIPGKIFPPLVLRFPHLYLECSKDHIPLADSTILDQSTQVLTDADRGRIFAWHPIKERDKIRHSSYPIHSLFKDIIPLAQWVFLIPMNTSRNSKLSFRGHSWISVGNKVTTSVKQYLPGGTHGTLNQT